MIPMYSPSYGQYRQCYKSRETDQQLKIGENRFEKVQSFVYLGSQMNVANSEKQEINIRIRNANKCYFGLI